MSIQPDRTRIGGATYVTMRPVIKVCVSGVTGWVGAPLAEAVARAEDLELISAVSRSASGQNLALDGRSVAVFSRVTEALDDVDVLVDYTAPDAALDHALTALERGVNVVIGASGLTGEDYDRIGAKARAKGLGVIAAGNFSLTAAMAQAATLLVAPLLPRAEVIDYAGASKPDVPSGTARELAERLAASRSNVVDRPLDEIFGPVEARGAMIDGVQVHSVRLPSFSVSTEVIFGLDHERLSIRHDADLSPDPYIAGTLLAIRRVVGRIGLTRGLDTLLLEKR